MVRSIKIIKNDTILLSISGKSLKIWNMADFQVIKELWHSGTLISLTISQDNEFIITGDIFGRIWVWELSSLSLKTVFSGPKSKIHRVEISEDFEWLAIGDIGLVRIYSLVLIQQVAALQLKSEVEAWKRLINLEGFLPYLK
jgi:WD40 repeat protein